MQSCEVGGCEEARCTQGCREVRQSRQEVPWQPGHIPPLTPVIDGVAIPARKFWGRRHFNFFRRRLISLQHINTPTQPHHDESQNAQPINIRASASRL